MKKLFITLSIIVVSANISFGQKFLNRLQNKVEERVNKKVEQKLDEKIDEEIDKGFDELEKENTSVKNNSDEENTESDYISEGTSSETYVFNQVIRYEFSAKKEKDKSVMEFLSQSGKTYNGLKIMSDENSTIIQISDASKSFTLMESAGVKMQAGSMVNMDKLMSKYEEKSNFDDKSTITKTGNTKDILGYKCLEYKVENDNGVSMVWLTENTVFENTLFYINHEDMKGLMLESNFNDGKKQQNSITATKIELNANVSINASEYKNMFGR